MLLLVIRLCISIQAFLMLLLLPNNFPLKRQVKYCDVVSCEKKPLSRIMLRVIFATLGIIVLLNEKHRDSSVKVIISYYGNVHANVF